MTELQRRLERLERLNPETFAMLIDGVRTYAASLEAMGERSDLTDRDRGVIISELNRVKCFLESQVPRAMELTEIGLAIHAERN